MLEYLKTLTDPKELAHLLRAIDQFKGSFVTKCATAALIRMGYKGEMSWHGFRAVARTILDEVLGFRPDFIEHQLAHAVRDTIGRAYNRTSHLPERKKMMQIWADYLDGLKQVAKVIPLRRTA